MENQKVEGSSQLYLSQKIYKINKRMCNINPLYFAARQLAQLLLYRYTTMRILTADEYERLRSERDMIVRLGARATPMVRRRLGEIRETLKQAHKIDYESRHKTS